MATEFYSQWTAVFALLPSGFGQILLTHSVVLWLATGSATKAKTSTNMKPQAGNTRSHKSGWIFYVTTDRWFAKRPEVSLLLTNTFYKLFTRWICAINPNDSRNITPGLPGCNICKSTSLFQTFLTRSFWPLD